MRCYVAHHRGQDRAEFNHREDVLRTLSRNRFIFETQCKEGIFEESIKEGSRGLNVLRN